GFPVKILASAGSPDRYVSPSFSEPFSPIKSYVWGKYRATAFCGRRNGKQWRGPLSLHLLDLAGPPGLVEPGLQRAVQAQRQEPAFAGDGLDPVGFLDSGGFLRGEIDVHRGVRVHEDPLLLAAGAGKLLVGLQLRTGLRVVDDD